MVNNFSLVGAVALLGDIQLLVRLANDNDEFAADMGRAAAASDPVSQAALAGVVSEAAAILARTENLLSFMPCSHIKGAADGLQYWMDREDKRWNDLLLKVVALRDAIKIEYRDYFFYAYPKEKGQKLKTWEKDWGKVTKAFPETVRDIYGATDCYALLHNTASVFHSMRVAEHGLRALAGERRLRLPRNKPVEWATWQEIIKALDDEIKAMGARKAGKAKDAALAFYSGARAELNAFKDEYRNAVMHVREHYDEFQALRALTNVHAFMGRLAEKIDHKHHRIRWGRF